MTARWEPYDQRLDVWHASQNPHEARLAFSRATGVPENNVRVQIGDVGGGFGLKSFVGRDEITIVMAAHMLNATIKWTEDRRENLIASAHARQERVDATMSVDADGIIQACDIAHFDDAGAFPMPGGSAGPLVGMLFTGPVQGAAPRLVEHHRVHEHLRERRVPRPVDDGDHRARGDARPRRARDRARPARVPSAQHPPDAPTCPTCARAA